jgi:hypothetical protein
MTSFHYAPGRPLVQTVIPSNAESILHQPQQQGADASAPW